MEHLGGGLGNDHQYHYSNCTWKRSSHIHVNFEIMEHMACCSNKTVLWQAKWPRKEVGGQTLAVHLPLRGVTWDRSYMYME